MKYSPSPALFDPPMTWKTEIIEHKPEVVAINLALKAAFSVCWEGVKLADLVLKTRAIAWNAL